MWGRTRRNEVTIGLAPPGLGGTSDPGDSARSQVFPNLGTAMLKDLEITGFRGFESLKIDHLGGVNLVLGKNGVGKTSLLESLWLYSAPTNPVVIREILESREEFRVSTSGLTEVDLPALFFQRQSSRQLPFSCSIGPVDRDYQVQIRYEPMFSKKDMESLKSQGWLPSEVKRPIDGDAYPALVIEAWGQTGILMPDAFKQGLVRFSTDYNSAPFMRLSGEMDKRVASWWSTIALSDAEDRIIQMMQLIAPVERIAMVGPNADEVASNRQRGGRFVIRLNGVGAPQPLKSLGDGAERLFRTALSIEFSRHQAAMEKEVDQLNSTSAHPHPPGWCVLLDEVDVGLHYSVLEDYWDSLFGLAHELGVQVFATTHSRECIEAFQKAALRRTDVDGVAIRLERSRDGIRAVTITETDLTTVVESGIEIR